MNERPDVLFVVLDSLRSDHVSTYGYERETTPALDRFATGASTYENAFVPAPWTLPSHCSMFTGRFPSEHGVTNGFTDRDLTLPSDYETVAQRLSDRGYRTGGFSNNPWVGQLSGLTRGFDRFVEWDLQVTRGTTPRRRDRLYSRAHSVLGRATGQPLVLLKRRFFTSNLVTRTRRWLVADERPTFTFLNLMEAHSPYYPPDWAFEALDLDPPSLLEARSLNTKLLAYVLGKRDLTTAEQRRVHEFLDASVRYQDAEFDRLLTALTERDRFEETLVVVCADHGKTLGEFDRDATPPHYVRDINVRVPLLVKRPGQTAAESVADPVELTDLFDLLSGPAPAALEPSEYAMVEDFLPHTGSESQDVQRWRVLSDGHTKYVRCEDGSEYVLCGSGETERIAPLGSVESDTLDRLRDELTSRENGLETPAAGEDPAGTVDDHLESQLHDLGYLG